MTAIALTAAPVNTSVTNARMSGADARRGDRALRSRFGPDTGPNGDQSGGSAPGNSTTDDDEVGQ